MNSAGVALIVLGIIALLISLSIHKIDEGHIGVYYRVYLVYHQT